MVSEILKPVLPRLFNQDEYLNTIIKKELKEGKEFYIKTHDYWKRLRKDCDGIKWKVEL